MNVLERLQLQRMGAYWYAFGYNDHRKAGEPYVDPHAFAEHWLTVQAQPSHTTVQDTFRAFMGEQR